MYPKKAMSTLALARKLYVALFWPFLAFLLFAIYAPLLISDPLLKRDDQILVEPLRGVRSVPEFLAHATASTNPDLQPLRDVSLMADVLLTRATGYGSFHAQNLLLWLIACALVTSLARPWVKDEFTLKAWALLFALHPSYVMTVSWVAARKHLLAFVFLLLTLLALRALLRAETPAAITRRIAWICLAYVASVFSQPVDLFLPVWIALLFALAPHARAWAARHRHATIALLAALGALMAGSFWATYHHYEAYYRLYDLTPEKAGSLSLGAHAPLGQSLLALGRYFYQIVAPTKLALLYSESSMENLAGLVALPLFALLCFRALGARVTVLALGFFAILLALVLVKIQTIFVSDTYALGASLGVWYLLIALWLRGAPRSPRLRYAAVAAWMILAATLHARAFALARTWSDDEAVWRNAYELEPNCDDSMGYAFFLFARGANEEAIPVTQFHLRNQCRGRISRSLSYLAIYHHPTLATAEKLELLDRERDPNPTRLAMRAALLIQAKRWPEADKAVATLIAREPRFASTLHAMEAKPLLDQLREACAAKKLKSCGEHPGRVN